MKVLGRLSVIIVIVTMILGSVPQTQALPTLDPAVTPPPPPIDLGDANDKGAQEPTGSYFYYYGSQRILLTPLNDELVIGYADNVSVAQQESVLAEQISGNALQKVEDLPSQRATRMKLQADSSAKLEDLAAQMRPQYGIRFVSPMLEWHGTIQMFFTDEVVVSFKETTSQQQVNQVLSGLGLETLREVEKLPGEGITLLVRTLQQSRQTALDIANLLHVNALVLYAFPNLVTSGAREPTQVQNIPAANMPQSESTPWNLTHIRAGEAWSLLSGKPQYSIRVAVVDQGVQRSHEDLSIGMAPIGYDAPTLTEYPASTTAGESRNNCWHGTHVAGIIAAIPDNGIGIKGIGKNFVSVVPVNITDSYCNSSLLVERQGIIWAAQHAEVINLSWEDAPNDGVKSALAYANSLGKVVVAASGNKYSQNVAFPANWPSVIAVGGSDKSDYRWQDWIGGGGSSFGNELDIAAPSIDIPTTDMMGSAGDNPFGNYALCLLQLLDCNGTSFASPSVAAVAAMMLVANPGLTPKQVQDILQRTAFHPDGYSWSKRSEEGGWNNEMGFGRLDAYEAVRAALYPPNVRILAGSITDQAQLVVTWKGDYHHVLYHNENIALSGGNSNWITLSGLGPGAYDFYLKTNHSLRKKITYTVQTNGAHYLSFDSLYLGDANGDNAVNISDFGIWKMDYLAAQGVPNYCATHGCRADFNSDGYADLSDFLVWKNSYLTTHEKGWGDGWNKTVLPDQPATQALTPSVQQSAVALSLQMPQNAVNVGDVFAVTALIDTNALTTTGATAFLHYDPGVLTLLDSDPATLGVQVATGSLYATYDRNVIYPDQGLIWVGAYNVSSTFVGAGKFFTATFQAIAAMHPTAIEAQFSQGYSVDSHITEGLGGSNLLTSAQGLTFHVNGAPQRIMPTITVTPNTNIHDYVAEIKINANDPYTQVQSVRVKAYINNSLIDLGSAQKVTDGWSVMWDTTGLPDDHVVFEVQATLPGGYYSSVFTDPIPLDRTPPTYSDHVLIPHAPAWPSIVEAFILTDDNLSGVKRIEMYVNDALDGSTNGNWIFVDAQDNANFVTLHWNTAGFTLGRHRIAFAMEDSAGNWNRWSDPNLPLIVYGPPQVFLPLVLDQ